MYVQRAQSVQPLHIDDKASTLDNAQAGFQGPLHGSLSSSAPDTRAPLKAVRASARPSRGDIRSQHSTVQGVQGIGAGSGLSAPQGRCAGSCEGDDLMASQPKTLHVDAPVDKVFEQWTKFDEYPSFMANIEEVHPTGLLTMHWRATVEGVSREWDAEVTELVRNRCIAWRGLGGQPVSGAVHFTSTAEGTDLLVRMDIDPGPIRLREGGVGAEEPLHWSWENHVSTNWLG